MYVSTIVAKLIIDRLYSSEASLNVGTARMGKVLQNVIQQLSRDGLSQEKRLCGTRSANTCTLRLALPCEHVGSP